MQGQWNATEAYDFSVYEDRIRKISEAPDIKAVKSRTKKKGRKAALSSGSVFLCGIFLVAFLVLTIYNNVAMIELGEELRMANEELAALQEESSVLAGKLASVYNAQSVKEYAGTELGMGKIDSRQICYIDLEGEEMIVRTKYAPDGSDVTEVLTSSVDTILEYLKIR